MSGRNPRHPIPPVVPAKLGVSLYSFFLSYGDEAVDLKNRVKHLIEEFNRQLGHSPWRVTVMAIDWRDLASKRAPAGGKLNDRFIDLARDSSVTIVLLADSMPPGCEEELLAVLDEAHEVDLKVFWLNPGDESSEVGKFLIEHKDDFNYIPLPGLNSEETWDKLVTNLVAVLLEALYIDSADLRPPSAEGRL